MAKRALAEEDKQARRSDILDAEESFTTPARGAYLRPHRLLPQLV